MTADTVVYGVREADADHTVIRCFDRLDALRMLAPGVVIVVSYDDGKTWVVEHCIHCHDDPPANSATTRRTVATTAVRV